MDKDTVVNKVTECTTWWIEERKKKLTKLMSNTMSLNPFLMPFIFEFHSLKSFDELIDIVIAKHLMTGHDTGFGKLIDEKILPNVFGAQKLDKSFRNNTIPYEKACFNEIDHIITRPNGKQELLSLKAGKWTIQLTMAMQLNTAFNEILNDYPEVSNKIVVGVFYGKSEDLTDKYRILRGINTGAKHDVIDLQKNVKVYSGKEFWEWLNNGQAETQFWVLEGIKTAIKNANMNDTNKVLVNKFKEHIINSFGDDVTGKDGDADWNKFLTLING